MGHQSSWEKSRTHQVTQVVFESETELVSAGTELTIVLAQDPIDGIVDLYDNGVWVGSNIKSLEGRVLTIRGGATGGDTYAVRYRSFSGPIAASVWG